MIVSVSSMRIGSRLSDDYGFIIKFFKNMSSSYITCVKLANIAAISTMKLEFMRLAIILLLVMLLLASIIHEGIVILDPPLIVLL